MSIGGASMPGLLETPLHAASRAKATRQRVMTGNTPEWGELRKKTSWRDDHPEPGRRQCDDRHVAVALEQRRRRVGRKRERDPRRERDGELADRCERDGATCRAAIDRLEDHAAARREPERRAQQTSRNTDAVA